MRSTNRPICNGLSSPGRFGRRSCPGKNSPPPISWKTSPRCSSSPTRSTTLFAPTGRCPHAARGARVPQARVIHHSGSLRRTIRYYDDDLVLVDYEAAVIIDKEDPADLVDIFEIATAQLLELRFYDAMLSRSMERLLADVRRARTTTWLLRSPFRKLARPRSGTGAGARGDDRPPRTRHHPRRRHVLGADLLRGLSTFSFGRNTHVGTREGEHHRQALRGAQLRDPRQARPRPRNAGRLPHRPGDHHRFSALIPELSSVDPTKRDLRGTAKTPADARISGKPKPSDPGGPGALAVQIPPGDQTGLDW